MASEPASAEQPSEPGPIPVLPIGAREQVLQRQAALDAALRWAGLVLAAELGPVRTLGELLEVAEAFRAFIQGARARAAGSAHAEADAAAQVVEHAAVLDDEGELPDDLLDVSCSEADEAILAAERERAAREAELIASGELAPDDALVWS